MTRSVTLPGGARLSTTARARFLVIGHRKGAKPAVEATSHDRDRALAHRNRLAARHPDMTWLVIDQATG